MMVAMLAIAVSATAQQQNYAGSSKFTDNWSAGLNGGVQTNLHDWNLPQGAAFGIELNKQLTPTFGITLEGNAGINNRRNWYKGASHFCNHTLVDQFSVLADGRINITNLAAGYKGTPRLFELETVTGLGYGHGYACSNTGYPKNDVLLAKAGLNFNFNLGQEKAWTVKVSPAVIWNASATGKLDNRYAVGQLTAGVVYHFGNSNKKHYMELPVPVVVEKQVVVEKVVEKLVPQRPVPARPRPNLGNGWSVNFEKGSAQLTNPEEVRKVADAIKATKDVSFRISGFTSPEGSEKVNRELGIARAEALKEALVKEGVEESRIIIDNEYETLRTATVKLK